MAKILEFKRKQTMQGKLASLREKVRRLLAIKAELEELQKDSKVVALKAQHETVDESTEDSPA